MSEVVERVARAHVAFLQKKDPETLPWERADEDMRDAMRELARETIAAMREPTQAMQDVGFSAACRHDNGDAVPNLEISRAVWQAMINEALR